ncbi:phosphonate ABC transporter ATP-binding protein [Pseudacidovorax intermedius]|uniref:phosphonate ABC transporter ATP-binding protein n=1 Tax=Pseudacidovorax intermedius TaxID=433924 RepID=UPI0025D179AC|nr:phosphonate ABC transporter ATP-binding protein [Pseudacidovorax intermedius]
MLCFDSVALRHADGTQALDGVSLDVPAGQFCVVLGASGAGKSTLLRTANGLARPTAGAVRVQGTPVAPRDLARLRPRIGMIHQQFNLVARATVAQNVLCGALPAMPLWRVLPGLFTEAARRKACALIEAVGLGEEHLLRRVGELSGGQQQRVGIARAFMLDPPLVLADEPVASLDPQTSHDVLDLLRRQARERGATVLCSLHQLDLAREFADRIVALRRGRVVFDGAPQAFGQDAFEAVYGRSAEAPAQAASPAGRRPLPAASSMSPSALPAGLLELAP